MTSKIKVDNINKVSDDSNIIKKCGTTTTIGSGASNPIVVDGSAITLGRCGGTVALASGATQTGFGRTGTVDWQTTPKTATFSAVSGEGYFCNTTSGSFTVNLPAGSAGAIVSVQDYNNTFDSNSLIIQVNGSEKINGGTASGNIELTTEGEGVTLVYVDATVGWRSIHQSNFADQSSNAQFVTATVSGSCNTIVTCGNFKTAIFKSPGTFCVSNGGNACGSNTLDYFVVAGGGGAGADFFPGGRVGAGGGGGGFRLSNSVGCIPAPTMSPLTNPSGLPVAAAAYPVTVGAGGAGDGSGAGGAKGSDSVFAGSSTITSAGGGGGMGHSASADSPGPNTQGGSGGGAQSNPSPSLGTGNTPPVSPPQGNPSGNASGSPQYNGGGGGGAGAVGGNAAPGSLCGGDGGDGSFIACAMIGPTAPNYGTPGPASGRYFAGGGGSKQNGLGGKGGGGNAEIAPATPPESGTVNTGGAGGGSRFQTSGAGGSGIVMIRYKFQ